MAADPANRPKPTFGKLMCANRGEIAIRVFRAASELGIRTVAIYSHEDRVHLHRYKADESYLVGRDLSPVAAYLDIDGILDIATDNGVDAIHPGYGFLSERADFARECAERGIDFIGPSPDTLDTLGDKISARRVASVCGVPVIPGTEDPVEDLAEVEEFASLHGYPILLKAAMGGGGRGMRVIDSPDALSTAFADARSEAAAAFGDGTLFVERFLDRPRHIEVQILGDRQGHRIHLYERDCSVQRRHQKLLEMAPAFNLDSATREQMFRDALAIADHVDYFGAGTVEFLVDRDGHHYFIEVNPRIQVEHTVTEQVTGIDIVNAQIGIAANWTLGELAIDQQLVAPRGYAIQCRVTTEDPEHDFAPDTGVIEVYRSGSGMGIRLDGGSGYAGARISPHYDPLLVKVTGSGRSFSGTVARLIRALSEFRLRGVKSNIPFLLNVLRHERFVTGRIDTHFVDDSPELFRFEHRRNRAQRLLRYLGDLIVNGTQAAGADGQPPARFDLEPGDIPIARSPSRRADDDSGREALTGWRSRLIGHGAVAFAQAVRAHGPVLLTDTTWRDAHQSLLATRVRTRDLVAIAPSMAELLQPAFSLEMWGGATFDVAMRFLYECPWQRLVDLRELVPNIPFQMLLRGANAVGYRSYPDNVVVRFIEEAAAAGIDVFRVFDSLNDLENLRFACDAVGAAGAVIEAAVCYTGDVGNPKRTKYSLDYYIDLVAQLVASGIHILAIKDMAGLLKPHAATLLVSAIRDAFPELPIHVHTHDTAGTGVASMMAAATAGADIVDAATPAMSGLTSQASMGALVAALRDAERGCDIELDSVQRLDSFWERVRQWYAPFESGLVGSSTDIYETEMPGGQYTNLRFQSRALGLAGRWNAIKHAYVSANRLLGDVIKVTPTSKVVGDLAQFMVQSDLSENEVVERAEELQFPQSVIEFFQGALGQPHGGFPEPLRSRVVGTRECFVGRPGAGLAPLDLDELRRQLEEGHRRPLSSRDVLSAALYPQVFEDYRTQRRAYSDLSVLPTRNFLVALEHGEEISVEIEHGKRLIIEYQATGELNARGERAVFFQLNGQPRTIRVADRSVKTEARHRERSDPADSGSLGAAMPGVVIAIHVAAGDSVVRGQALVVNSAMKLETSITAPFAGIIGRVAVVLGDVLEPGDLILTLNASTNET